MAPGAQQVDFVADEAYDVTPLLSGFADVLNQVANAGFDRWIVSKTQLARAKSHPTLAETRKRPGQGLPRTGNPGYH